MNREASPANSIRRQRSLQPLGTPTNQGSLPGTPTRRSARLSALLGNSAQQVSQVLEREIHDSISDSICIWGEMM